VIGPRRANAPSLGVVTNGRPIFQARSRSSALGRDGTFYVVAPTGWRGIATGNTSFIGIEAENTGKSEPWPEIQMGAYHRGVAAIVARIGADALMCCGHGKYALQPAVDIMQPRSLLSAQWSG
jgi:hypothetical protein